MISENVLKKIVCSTAYANYFNFVSLWHVIFMNKKNQSWHLFEVLFEKLYLN